MSTVLYNKVKKVFEAGILFDSKLEAQCYRELIFLKKRMDIASFEYKPCKFSLSVLGVKIGTYEPDFTYLTREGKKVVREVKGHRTSIFNWKWKHFKAQYKNDFDIFEIWPDKGKRK